MTPNSELLHSGLVFAIGPMLASFLLTLFIALVTVTMAMIGWALVEVFIQMLFIHPPSGVVYRPSPIHDVIERALKGETGTRKGH